MARQRITRQEDSSAVAAEQDVVGPRAEVLVHGSARAPGELVSGLLHVDPGTRRRAVQRLQAGAGNGAVGGLLGSRHFRTTHLTLERRTGDATTRTTIQREEGDVADPGAQTLDTTAGGGGATETVGPPASSTYAVSASSLADVMADIGGRDEAGHVGWLENMRSEANTGVTIDTVTVNVDITLEMPSWSPPSTMLPKARAEWTRWYGALLAHEQGHIKLVHDVHDGIAKRILGKTLPVGKTIFDTAKASLKTKSDAYDAKTGHGIKTGTILNVGIEQVELDEEQKKKDAAAKARSRESAVPDVPGDE